MTRLLILGASAIALSGCSWLGIGNSGPDYDTQTGYYGAQAGTYAPKPCGTCAPRYSKWNVEGAIGPSFIVGGDAFTPEGTNPGLGAELREVSMDSAFETGVRGELGVSKMLNPNRKLTLMGNYVQHDGENDLNLGTLNGAALTGGLSDYKSYGAELGLRQYGGVKRMPLVKSVRPYIEGRVGGAYVEDIALTTNQTGRTSFYDGSFVPTAAGLVGVETPFFGNSTIGLETGIRYAGVPESDNADLAPGNPIRGFNDGGEKWSVPLVLRGRYRF